MLGNQMHGANDIPKRQIAKSIQTESHQLISDRQLSHANVEDRWL